MSSVEYAFEEGAYQLARRLTFEATIEDAGGLAIQQPKRHLSGLPLQCQVRQGDAGIGDTSQRQTQLPDDDHGMREVITRAIGTCAYMPRQGHGRHEQESLFADVYLEDWIFDDLWSAVRVPRLIFPRIDIDVFGNQLVVQRDVAFLDYHWNPNKFGDWNLLVAGFHYASTLKPDAV